MVTERTIEVQGYGGPISLALAEAGVGGRPLLLLHGFTGAKEDFTDYLDSLAERGWHAVAPDQRGHGGSTQPDAEAAYTFEAFTTDLLALFDALEWERCVTLGHSMGGMVVQTAILAAPERFDGLILMDTSHRGLRADPELVVLGVAIARTEGIAAVMAAQEALGSDQPLGTAPHQRLVDTRPGYKAFGDRKMLASSAHMYAAMLQTITAATGIDRLPDLSRITVPTLVLVGEEDAPFRKPSQRMAEAIPGAELVVLPDGGHSPQFESPELWWKALTAFLDRL
jgi:pimeloyl-ACP methyl ester carboxylesterase